MFAKIEFEDVLETVIKNVEKDVLPKIGVKELLVYVRANRRGFLGQYHPTGFKERAIVFVSKGNIMKASKEPDACSLYDIIETTIMHELGHHLQFSKGKPMNEEEAEEFAYMYWDWGEIIEI